MGEKGEERRDGEAGQGLFSAAMIMAAAALVSSVLGVVRTMVFSREFGTTPAFSAYAQAFKIPDLFYFLVAGGALRTGFIPVFTQFIAERRPDRAWRTFSATFFALLILGSLVVGLGMVFAPWLARETVAVGLEPEYQALCGKLMRIMLPAQLFFMVGGLLMGTLNAMRHFTWPAIGPIIYNTVVIAGALASLPIAVMAGVDAGSDRLMYRLAVLSAFVVIGAALGNVLAQVPPMRRFGARLWMVLDLRDEGLRKIAILALPVVLGLAVSEINFTITTAIASMLPKGPSILEYTNRIWKLPPRMFGAGFAMALFPTLATHFVKGEMERYRHDLARVMRSTLFWTLPSAVVCAALAEPVVRLLLEGRRFSPDDTLVTASALAWSSLGIVPLSMQYIAARGFYALHETKLPVWVGLGTAALNTTLAFLTYRPFGICGLVAVYSLSTLAGAVVLTWLLRCRVGLIEGRKLAVLFAKLMPPCAALAAACYFGAEWIMGSLGTQGFGPRVAACFGPVTVGGVLFVGLCVILKVEDLQAAASMFAARFRPRRRGPTTPV